VPIINVVVATEEQRAHLLTHCTELKHFLARELSCDKIELASADFTLWIFVMPREGRLADVELLITAHAFPERVERQDSACFNIEGFMKANLGLDAKAWLALCELGHNINLIS